MSRQVVPVTPCVTLGEAPHWDGDCQTLYYVDVYGNHLVRYVPATNHFEKISVAPHKPSFIVTIENRPYHFLVSLDNHLKYAKWTPNGELEIIEDVCKFHHTEQICEGIRLSDGKCDKFGRLWAGTIALFHGELTEFPKVGTLNSIDQTGTPKCHTKNVSISNGIVWNYDLGKMYYIDSGKGCIDVHDYDPNDCSIKHEKVQFTLSKHNIPGIPDGMTIDTDGNLWVAVFNGARILKIDGRKPETLLETIEMPCDQVTSMTWGGKNLDELYVTTGALEWGCDKPPEPAGALFRITGTGCRGFLDCKYKSKD